MAAVAALLVLLAPVAPIPVTVPQSRYVALLFQPVLLRCDFPPVSSDVAPPIVTWKFKSVCPSGDAGDNDNGDCPQRTVRIVATKQGDTVTLGDAYRGRGVTIQGGADLSLGAAAWGDSGTYVCTVTSTGDLSGDNEGQTYLLVLASLWGVTDLVPGLPDWLFVVLVLLGAALVALVLGLCWCQCCPHTCCCLLRCPCCPQRCCCPEALYWAGKAATSGLGGVAYGHPPQPIPLHTLSESNWGNWDKLGPTGNTGSSQGSHVPLLGDTGPPLPLLRFLEPTGAAKTAPPPSDITSLHESPDAWVPPPNSWVPPPNSWVPPPNSWVPPPNSWVPPSPAPPSPSPPSSRGRWHSAEVLAGSPRPRPRSRSRDDWTEVLAGSPRPRPRSRSRDDWTEVLAGSPGPRPRSRSRDDWLEPGGGVTEGGGAKARPRPHGSPRRLRKNDALSRESLVV
ncbi:lipolysis-stimulated lipoprotein receptor [Patagioenas fasciata]|uniref:lipolysis-stimulated lipoprotein receptor n=1 Tax=Patagioenas fasciata TaxID=372321 RepID=UPI003A997209